MTVQTQLPLRISRVGVLGDVHTEDRLLDLSLKWLQALPAMDALLCTGDIVSGAGDASRCCALLQEAGVLTVRGNHDRWFFTDSYHQMMQDATPVEELTALDREFLAGLPVTRTFLTPRGPLLLCHGTDTNDMDAVYPQDSEAVLTANHRLHALYQERYYHFLLGGHTHQRMVRQFDHLTILNAGTLRHDKHPGFMVIDFAAGTAELFDLVVHPQTVSIAGKVAL